MQYGPTKWLLAFYLPKKCWSTLCVAVGGLNWRCAVYRDALSFDAVCFSVGRFPRMHKLWNMKLYFLFFFMCLGYDLFFPARKDRDTRARIYKLSGEFLGPRDES
jgi:hypothetical protein